MVALYQLPSTVNDPSFMGVVVAARSGFFADQCLDVLFVESASPYEYEAALDKITVLNEADVAFTDAASLLEAQSLTSPNKPVWHTSCFDERRINLCVLCWRRLVCCN